MPRERIPAEALNFLRKEQPAQHLDNNFGQKSAPAGLPESLANSTH